MTKKLLARNVLAGAGALTIAVAALATLPSAPVQAADDMVVVVDATDLYRNSGPTNGPRLSELSGAPVYGNGGQQIGVIEDFAVARGGEIVAVIDADNGPLDDLLMIADEETLVVPLRELRTTPMAAFKARQ